MNANTNTATNAAIPATRNEGWGFFGTMNEHAAKARPLAMTAISNATREPLESVRAFLDAVPGRHFADDVHNAMHGGLDLAAAVEAATQKWMGWTIRRSTSSQYGIPRGLPYLTGFVIHCGVPCDTE